MIPRILIYEDGQLTITENALSIPELRAIIDKYGDKDSLPYLTFVSHMSYPDSPYVNLEGEEKLATIIYDTQATMGMFDFDDKLLDIAIAKMEQLFTSRTKKYFDGLSRLMDKVSVYSKTAEVSDENLSDINRTLKDAGSTMRSFKDAEKQVDEEIKTKMKGKNILGEY